MRNRRNTIILILLMSIFALGTKIYSQDTVTTLDIKTKLSEKADLAPAKSGLILYLKQLPKIKITETGEDYSVWLRNYNSEKKDDDITVSLDLEVRTPAAIRTGRLLEKKSMKVRFKDGEKLKLPADNRFTVCQECTAEQNFVGYRLADELVKILNNHLK